MVVQFLDAWAIWFFGDEAFGALTTCVWLFICVGFLDAPAIWFYGDAAFVIVHLLLCSICY